MVKPPLAWWRGQRILTDGHHNLQGIDPGGVEHTPLSSMYNVNIKLPKKVMPFICMQSNSKINIAKGRGKKVPTLDHLVIDLFVTPDN